MSQAGKIVDALRTSEEEQAAILGELEAAARMHAEPEQRTSTRYRYTASGGLTFRIAGATASYIVRPRNLSTGGISILHGSFVYPRSTCSLMLKTITKEDALVSGKVVSCRCVRGRVHEIGIQFDHPIKIEDFIPVEVEAPPAQPAPSMAAMSYPGREVTRLARELVALARDDAPGAQVHRKVMEILLLLRQAK